MKAAVTYDAVRLEEACEALGLRMVVLYGSWATGSPPPTAESDLDVAVLGRGPCDPSTFSAWYRGLAEVFPSYALDLALVCRADPLFRYEIFRAGVLLYGDRDDFAAYRTFAFRAYHDAADLRALEDVLFEKRMVYIRSELDGAS